MYENIEFASTPSFYSRRKLAGVCTVEVMYKTTANSLGPALSYTYNVHTIRPVQQEVGDNLTYSGGKVSTAT